MLRIFTTDSAKILLAGYLALALLFAGFWWLDSWVHEEQQAVLDSTEQATRKMRLLADLIEIARSRTRLSFQLLTTEDVFEKDALSMQVSELAGKFSGRYRQLKDLPLSSQERQKLAWQRERIQVVVDNLERVADLGMGDNPVANRQAQDLLIRKVLPAQQEVVDAFMEMLRGVQQEATRTTESAKAQVALNDDYRGGIGLVILVLSLGVLLWSIRHISLIEDRLNVTSLTDGLTDIANRRRFDVQLAKAWKRSLRSGAPISLLLVDIDHFKAYNDHYGHQQGDACLHQVAQIIRQAAQREGDVAARYGGEEFAVLLPDTECRGAELLADSLRSAVARAAIAHEGSAALQGKVSVSIGISCMTATRRHKPTVLVQRADEALYASKRNGRDRASIYSAQKSAA